VVRFHCLGPFVIGPEGSEIVVKPCRRSRLLAALLAQPKVVLSADQVVEEIWEQDIPPRAANTVHAHVARLRRDLNSWLGTCDVHVDWRYPGYVLRIDEAEVDLCAFTRLVADCQNAWPADPLRCAEYGGRALALWRGVPFAGHELGPVGRIARVRLEEARLATLEIVLDARLALGLHRQQIAELRELVATNPFMERFHEQLILALYRSGRLGAALDAYHSARRTLRKDLGVEPSPQLSQRAAQVLRHDPDLWRLSDGDVGQLQMLNGQDYGGSDSTVRSV
jgi:DNA-binding SARP family transcriptional activator